LGKFFSLKRTSTQSSGGISSLLLIIGLAAAWHFGLAVIERRVKPDGDKIPVTRLLLMTEADVLRSVVAEIRRRLTKRKDGRLKQKLAEAEGRLGEIEKISNGA
jgi:hypothetical protein